MHENRAQLLAVPYEVREQILILLASISHVYNGISILDLFIEQAFLILVSLATYSNTLPVHQKVKYKKHKKKKTEPHIYASSGAKINFQLLKN